MKLSPQDVVKRFQALQGQRKTVEQTWQAIERYVAPYKGQFFRQQPSENAIEWATTRDIFDSTAVMAHVSLASSIHGALTNPILRWFDLQWRDKRLRENHAARIWLENTSKRIFDELQDSNFNLEINHAYRGLTSFGTAFITQEPKADLTEPWQGVNFTSVPLKEGYFEPGEHGVKNFYRLLRWRASKLIDKFGRENCPEKVRTNYDQANDQLFDVVFCVYDTGQSDSKAIQKPENRRFQYCYVDLEAKHCYAKGGYYEQPAYAPRWDTVDESIWGYSPAHVALADILTLNQLISLHLTAIEKSIDPTILANQRALLGDLSLGAGEVNKVRDIDGIRPFESSARHDVTQMKVEDLRAQINRYFHIDQLEMKESPAMTATEVQVRYELMQRLLSSTLSQIKEDLLDPLLQRTFNLLYRSGELGALPDGVENTDYDIEYVGPLNRAQRFDQAASLERWFTQLQLIAQSGPEAEKVLSVPDYEKVARFAAESLNLPTELTRDPDTVNDAIKAKDDQQARAEGAQAAANEATAAKDIVQAEQMRGGNNPNIAGVG